MFINLFESEIVGCSIFLDALYTANEISGLLLFDKYIRDPIALLYIVYFIFRVFLFFFF